MKEIFLLWGREYWEEFRDGYILLDDFNEYPTKDEMLKAIKRCPSVIYVSVERIYRVEDARCSD